MHAQEKQKEQFEERLKVEETEEDGGISTKQALVYLAIVVACFAILYPKIIHPMVLTGLGITEKKPEPTNNIPPHMRTPGAPIPGRPVPSSRPLPAAAARERMAGEAAEKGGKSGSGGIMMSLILPVYAFGIMGYLLYTASKVYGGKNKKGKDKKKNKHDEIYDLITSRLSTINLEGVLSGTDLKGAEEINKLADYLRKKHYNEDANLEEKVVKKEKKTPYNNTTSDETSEPSSTTPASPTNLSEAEVIKLQQKLANMETEMAQLMSAIKQNQTTNQQTAEEISTNQHPTEEISINQRSGENLSTSQKSPIETKSEVSINIGEMEAGCNRGSESPEDDLGSEDSSEDTEELLQGLGNTEKVLYEHIPHSSDEESLASDSGDLISDEDDIEYLGEFDPEAGFSVRRRNVPLDDADDSVDY